MVCVNEALWDKQGVAVTFLGADGLQHAHWRVLYHAIYTLTVFRIACCAKLKVAAPTASRHEDCFRRLLTER